MIMNAEIAAAHLGNEIRRGSTNTSPGANSAVTLVLTKPSHDLAENSFAEKKQLFS